MKIQPKVNLIFTLIITFFVLIIGSIGFLISKNSLKRTLIDGLENVADNKVDKIELFFKEQKHNIAVAQDYYNIKTNFSIVNMYAGDRANPAYITAEKILDAQLYKLKKIYKYIDIMLVDTEGNIVYALNNEHKKEEFGHSLPVQYEKAFEEGKKLFYFSEVFINNFGGDVHEMLVTAPVYSNNETLIGVLAFEIGMETLYEFAIKKTLGVGETGETLIAANAGGYALFLTPLSYDPDAALNRKVVLGERKGFPVQEAVQGRSGSGIAIDYRGEEVIAAWRYIPSLNWGLVTKIDTAEAFAPITYLRRLTTVILAAGIILVSMVSYFLTLTLTKPINKLVASARSISKGNLTERIDIKRRDEIGVLADTFNTMVSNLNRSYTDLEMKVADRTRALELSNLSLKKKGEKDLVYNEIITILNSTMDTGTLLSKVLDKIVAFTCSQVGIVYLYDEREQLLKAGACYAIGSESLKTEEFSLGIGIPGQTAQKKERIVIRDIPEDTIFKVKHGLGESMPKNIGSFPLLLKDKLLGVLVLASLKEYSGEVLDFINNVNVQISVAISNTKAFELVQEQAEKLKKQGAKLIERETYLSTILDNTVDGIITINERGIIESFNHAAERIFGYMAPEVVGKNINMLQPEPYRSNHDGYIRNYLNTGVKKVIGVGREVVGQRKDGSTFPLELSVSEVFVNEKRVFTGLVRDITQRKETEEELKCINEELQNQAEELREQANELKKGKLAMEQKNREVTKANRTKSEFLANMSHELRTPLNSIIGFSEVLEDQTFGELNVKQKKYVNNIRTSGVLLLQLINDILDLSKVESGKMELNYEEFSLPDAIKESHIIMKTQMDKKNISYKMEVDEQLSFIKADRKKFKQIMHNILSNAVKFTPAGGKIAVTAKRADEFVEISVKDTGIGIKPEDQERIFDEFQQIDSKASREYEGTGLGLSLTRRFVVLHGGEICVESKPGKGSTFAFTIPLKLKEKSSEVKSLPLKNSDEIKEKREGSLILVVEDDPRSGELLQLFLKQKGYQTATAVNGYEAVKKAKELRPLAITLDINLPGKDGWAVLTELKQMHETKDIPVIIISILEDRERGFHLGAVDFLIKPINKRDLLRALENCGISSTSGEGTIINVLIVDDDPKTAELVSATLEAEGYHTQKAFGGQEGIDFALANEQDLIILDLMMPEVDGFTVVDELKKHNITKDVPIIILTARNITKEDIERLRGKVLSIAQKGRFSKEDLLKDIKKIEKIRKEKQKG